MFEDKKMKNIREVRKELVKMFGELKAGQVEVKAASEMNNTAGKIIKSLQVQLDYSSLRDEKPRIAFLDCR